MKIGLRADTHDRLERTRRAVDILLEAGSDVLIHCGDLTGPAIVEACSVRHFYFVFGNHDADTVPDLVNAATEFGANCLAWGGTITLAETEIGVVHGHLTPDIRLLLEASPSYLFSGHSHQARDWKQGRIRRINPRALHRARDFSAAVVDLETDDVQFLPVPR